MRRLTLHASALNNEEYDLYTSSIVDLALCNQTPENSTRGDAFFEEITVSAREVRAWLRGRYPDIPTENIDTILKFFSPVFGQGDMLSGGQFFAVLRLVVHVQNGREVDRGLAFVQAHPPPSVNSLSTPKLTSEYPPPQLPKRSDGYAGSSTSEATIITPLTNPFSYDSRQQPPLHPSQRPDSNKSVHSPNNPFVFRSRPISEDGSGRIPPLPPRKPSVQNPPPPPRHASISSSTSVPAHPQVSSTTIANTSHPLHSNASQPLSHSHPPPPLPPKLKPKPITHITSTLIKQSLQASKTAQTMKKAEEQLEKERVLQVLRSSAVVTGSNMRSSDSGSQSSPKRIPTSQRSVTAMSDSSTSWSGGEERERPPPPRRRRQQQQQPSPPMSTSSLEQVALAVAPSGMRSHPHTPFTSSPFDSPNNSPHMRPTLDLPGAASLPPPTHPDRKLYGFPHQMPSTVPDENSPPSSLSPFRRNLESFEAVYGTGSTTSSLSTATPTTPTTTSDLTSSPGSPQQRVHRSKSLHHSPTLQAPPPPPARRRRPESVQLLSNGELLFGGGSPTKSPLHDSNNALKNSITQTPHRRSSYSSSIGGGVSSSSIFGGGSGAGSGSGDALQRKIAELQLKAENALPKLEAARYKAEAGLSRRGFIQGPNRGRAERSRSRIGVKDDREGLMNRYSVDGYSGGVGGDGEINGVLGGGGLSVDSDDDGYTRSRREREIVERDELKWPAGEGWSRML